MKAKKTDMNMKLIAYWVATGLLTFILLFSGIGALTKQDFLIEAMLNIDFPLYVMNILGTDYTLAAIAIIAPGFPRLKEWAYAGVVFAMTAAFASHVAIGDTFENMIPPLVILSITVVSYMLRPKSRRLVTIRTEETHHNP